MQFFKSKVNNLHNFVSAICISLIHEVSPETLQQPPPLDPGPTMRLSPFAEETNLTSS